MKQKIGAIVLAAGKGTRLESKDFNKVTLSLGGKPMILHTINLLNTLHVQPIVVVVGFAKESVMTALNGQDVIFVEQTEQLGVAHAALMGLKKIPQEVSAVLILNGDDSAWYTKELLQELVDMHLLSNASLTFLTIHMDNPQGLGRIVREGGKPVAVVEEKDATDRERRVHEVNVGCYVASVSFLNKYLPMVNKSTVMGEYYLTDIVALGVKHGESVQAIYKETFNWRGVNTKEELEEAQRLFAK